MQIAPINAANIVDMNIAEIIAAGIDRLPKLLTILDCKNNPNVYAPEAKNAAWPNATRPKYPIKIFKDNAKRPNIKTFWIRLH